MVFLNSMTFQAQWSPSGNAGGRRAGRERERGREGGKSRPTVISKSRRLKVFGGLWVEEITRISYLNHPGDEDDENSKDNRNDVGDKAGVVNMNGHDERQQAGNEQREA